MNQKELTKIFSEEFKETVLPYIEKKLPRSNLSDPIYYYIDNFPLRTFRSVMPLLIFKELKIDLKYILPVAAASELMFFIALVQDDVIDRDDVRGDMESAHKKFGTEKTIAAADYTTISVMDMINDLSGLLDEEICQKVFMGFVEAHKRLYKSFITELEGVLDLEKVDENYVKEIHLDKTIQGINSLTCTGIILDHLLDKKVFENGLKHYSELLAVIGQIKNDIYDFTRYSKTRGYSDIKNGYITYPVLHLLQSGEIEKVTKAYKKSKGSVLNSLFKKHNTYDFLSNKMINLAKESTKIVDTLELHKSTKDIMYTWIDMNCKINTY